MAAFIVVSAKAEGGGMRALKMVTGFAAASRVCRLGLFAAMAAATWWFYATVDMRCFPVWMMTFANSLLAMLFTMFSLASPDSSSLRRAPLAVWTRLSSGDGGIRVWMVLAWPLMVPAEVVICVLVAAAAILNHRLDAGRDD